jgi:hypothetical protein
MNTTPIDHTQFTHHYPHHAMSISDGPSAPRSRRESGYEIRCIDDDLATRVAHGDIDAATELATRHAKHLREVALRIVDDDVEADAIVEAALEDAFRGWPPERGQVRRWLTRLVRRRALARKRALSGLGSLRRKAFHRFASENRNPS